MGGSHDNRKGSENSAQVGDVLVLHGEVVVSLRLPASVFVSLFFALLVCFLRSVQIAGPPKVTTSLAASLTPTTVLSLLPAIGIFGPITAAISSVTHIRFPGTSEGHSLIAARSETGRGTSPC